MHFSCFFTAVSNGNSLGGSKILTVVLLWQGFYYCGAKEFNCGGTATLNAPWKTLLSIHVCKLR
jgi:hypothetical protein